jgi:hypothetical protein
VLIDWALGIEEHQQHLFCLAGMDPSPWAMLPLFNQQLGLIFDLRGVIKDYRLIHSYNGIQQSEGMAEDGSNKIDADVNMQLFLLV